MQSLCLHLGEEHVPHFVHGLCQIGLFRFQFNLSAFNTAHIQHVINQRQKVLAGCLDLRQVLCRFRRQVFLLTGQHRVTDNRVHGSADIVAHVGKERALGLGAPFRLLLLPFRLPFPFQYEPENQEQDHHNDNRHGEKYNYILIQRVDQIHFDFIRKEVAVFLPLLEIHDNTERTQLGRIEEIDGFHGVFRRNLELLPHPDGRRDGNQGYQPQPNLRCFAQPRFPVVSQQDQEQQGPQHGP